MRALLDFRFTVLPFVVVMLGVPANATDDPKGRIVAEINMVGFHHKPTQDILPPLRCQVGQPYQPALVQEDVRTLIATDEFGGVQARFKELADGNISLFFIVSPLPIVIEEIVYQGAQVVKPGELEGVTGLKIGMRVLPELLQADCAKIVQHYAEKGHPFATCVLLKDDASDGRIVFSIEVGPEVIVQGVEIEGNADTSAPALQEYLKTMPRLYTPSAVDQMASRLRAIFAYGHCYSNVSPELRWNAEHTGVTVVFKVDRGDCYQSNCPPPSPEFTADEYKSQPPPAQPEHLPARSDILRALDADSCEQEITRVSYAMLFEVRSQWQDGEETWGFGIWQRGDNLMTESGGGVLFPARQEIALDPMKVTTQPLVWRDQLYGSRSLYDKSPLKLFRHELTTPSTRAPDLPPTRKTRYLLTSFMLGFFSIQDVYVDEEVDLDYVNLLMRQSCEALLNGERIEAERLLGQAWFHDPEGVASHPLLPRIHVLSNAELNQEQQELYSRQPARLPEIQWPIY